MQFMACLSLISGDWRVHLDRLRSNHPKTALFFIIVVLQWVSLAGYCLPMITVWLDLALQSTKQSISFLQVVSQWRSLQAGKSAFDSNARERLKKMKFELQTTNIQNRILNLRITVCEPQGRAATTWLLRCHLQGLGFGWLLLGSSQATLSLKYFWQIILK